MNKVHSSVITMEDFKKIITHISKLDLSHILKQATSHCKS